MLGRNTERRIFSQFLLRYASNTFCQKQNFPDIESSSSPQLPSHKSKNSFLKGLQGRVNTTLSSFKSVFKGFSQDSQGLLAVKPFSLIIIASGFSQLNRDVRLGVFNSLLIFYGGEKWFASSFVKHFPDLLGAYSVPATTQEELNQLLAERRAAALTHLRVKAEEIVDFDFKNLRHLVEKAQTFTPDADILNQLREADATLIQHFLSEWEMKYSAQLGQASLTAHDVEAWLRVLGSFYSWQPYWLSVGRRIWQLVCKEEPAVDLRPLRANTVPGYYFYSARLGLAVLLQRVQAEDVALSSAPVERLRSCDQKIIERMLMQRAFGPSSRDGCDRLCSNWLSGEDIGRPLMARLWLQLLRENHRDLLQGSRS